MAAELLDTERMQCGNHALSFDHVRRRRWTSAGDLLDDTGALTRSTNDLWLRVQIFWVDTSQTTLFETVSCSTQADIFATVDSQLALSPQQTSKPLHLTPAERMNDIIFGESGEKVGLLSRSIESCFSSTSTVTTTSPRCRFLQSRACHLRTIVQEEPSSSYQRRRAHVLQEFTLVVSFLEIYCDRVRDLPRECVYVIT
ncbi:hypothetical protein PybrP1_000836 [[Pythium] brassicae (nom. inval.)]|nr:hypothetical protein PybrP1_000836 [[Pythium] brassicae (nom. inval.)]